MYKEINARYEPEILRLKRELYAHTSSENNLKDYINYTLEMMENIDKLFVEVDLDEN